MERHTLVHQGRERRWIEIPGDANTLLLVLHGSLQSGNVMRNFTDRTFEGLGPTVVYLLFDAPGLLTGAATFGASMPTPDNTLISTQRYQPTRLLSVQGTEDPLVPYHGGMAGIGGNNRGETRSATGSAEFFAGLNGCDGHVTSTSGTLRVDDWTGTHPVRLVSLEGAGHMVPVDKDLDPRLGHNPKTPTGGDLIQQFFFA